MNTGKDNEMVSNIIHQAMADMGAFIDENPAMYEGYREQLDSLAEHMDEVLTLLDTPPRTDRETVQ
jgi:hypothetical protein